MNKAKKNTKHSNKLNEMKRMLHGAKLHVPERPPQVTRRPWYPLIVQVTGVVHNLQVFDLNAALVTQLQLPSGFLADFLIKKIRVYASLVKSNTNILEPLMVSIYEIISEKAPEPIPTLRTLATLESFPDQTNRAAVGYVYPLAQASTVFNADGSEDFRIARIDNGGITDPPLILVDVLWRSNSQAT